LTVEATSNEFIVDETPPVSGWVSIVSSLATDFDVKQITSRYVCSGGNLLFPGRGKAS
jgi:hypothetical protein